jgi:hypothetical protein
VGKSVLQYMYVCRTELQMPNSAKKTSKKMCEDRYKIHFRVTVYDQRFRSKKKIKKLKKIFQKNSDVANIENMVP